MVYNKNNFFFSNSIMENNNPDDSVKLVLHDAENKLEDKADEVLDHALM